MGVWVAVFLGLQETFDLSKVCRHRSATEAQLREELSAQSQSLAAFETLMQELARERHVPNSELAGHFGMAERLFEKM